MSFLCWTTHCIMGKAGNWKRLNLSKSVSAMLIYSVNIQLLVQKTSTKPRTEMTKRQLLLYLNKHEDMWRGYSAAKHKKCEVSSSLTFKDIKNHNKLSRVCFCICRLIKWSFIIQSCSFKTSCVINQLMNLQFNDEREFKILNSLKYWRWIKSLI